MQVRVRIMITGMLLLALAGFGWAQGSASISGSVTDGATGEGVAEATITAFSVGPDSAFYFAQSNSDGSYRIDNVIAGVYFFAVDAPGYLPSIGDTISVSANSQNTFNIQLTPEPSGDGEISGNTIDAATGELIPFVSVNLYGPGFYSALSDSGGFYSLNGIIDGPYTIEAFAQGYFPFYADVPVDIVSGAPVNFDIQLSPDSLSQGDAALFGNVSSTDGTGIAGATILAFGNTPTGTDSLLYITQSDNNGTYIIENMVGSTYMVICEAPGFTTETLFGVSVFDSTEVNFVLSPDSGNGGGTASVEGIVFDAVIGIPIENATLTLEGELDSSGVAILISAQTLPGGIFFFNNVPPGTYDITCEALGFQSQTIEDIVVSENSHQFFDFAMVRGPIEDGGVITGQITFDATGNPVPGVFVEFIGDDVSIWGNYTYSDSTGFYYGIVPPGDYVVSIHYYDPQTYYAYVEYYDDVLSIAEATQISVAEGDSITGINFGVPDSFPGSFELSGNVSDDNGNPLSDALVTLRSFENVFGVMDSLIYTANTDAQGNYTILIDEVLYPFNLYVAMAEKEGYDAEFWFEKASMYEADPIPVYAGGVMPDIDFTLSAEGTGGGSSSIAGQVLDEVSGAPISGAFVVGSNLNTGQIAFAFSGAQGDYELGGLSNEPHVVLFAANGYVPEFFDNVWLWEDATPIIPGPAGTNATAFLTPFDPDTTRGNIVGSVKDQTGTGISGVLLTIQNSNGDVVGYDFTDAMGSYSIPGMNTGDYTVQASKLEWMSATTDVSYALSSPTMMVDFNLNMAVTSIEDEDGAAVLPETLLLEDNYPNPFNPSTTIKIGLPEAGEVKLTVYNILGQPVKTLYEGQIAAGTHSFQWDGTGNAGQAVSTGIYFYSLETANQRLVKKMLFSK